jgi:cytochrome c oxidase assembly protein subunit 15
MNELAVGRNGELRRLRLFLTITVVATFALIIVGAVVRITDSGLGCGPAGSGIKGWPLCGGRALPLIEENSVIEFSHRALASVVVALILLCVWQARRLPGQTFLRRGTIVAALLVLAQAVLGGLTVEHNLAEVLVAAHLGMAMLLLGTLLTLRWATAREQGAAAPRLSGRGLRPLATAASVLVLATIVAGGVIAGSEEEGVKNGVTNGAHLACGDQFPGCLGGGPLPFGRHGHLADIQLTHRALVYATSLTVLALLGLALYRRVWSRELSALGALLVLQVLLGALNVWLGKHPGLVVAHLTTGTLLWAAAVSTALRLSPVPRTASRPSAAEPETSAAPA